MAGIDQNECRIVKNRVSGNDHGIRRGKQELEIAESDPRASE
jgi:hypothetical protein